MRARLPTGEEQLREELLLLLLLLLLGRGQGWKERREERVHVQIRRCARAVQGMN